MVSWYLSSFRNADQFAHGGHQLALIGRGKHGQLLRFSLPGTRQGAREQTVAFLGTLHPLHAAIVWIALTVQQAAALHAVQHGDQRTRVQAAQLRHLVLRDISAACDHQQPELSRPQPQRLQSAIQPAAGFQPDLPIAKPQPVRRWIAICDCLRRGRFGGNARHTYKVRRNSRVAPDNTTTEVKTSAKTSVVTAATPTSLSSSERNP